MHMFIYKRYTLAAILAVAAFALAPLHAEEEEGEEIPAEAQPVITEDGLQLPRELNLETHKKIQKGLKWLLDNQNRDGSWGCQKAGVPSAAVTGLACMALMSTGDTPERGKHAKEINRALQWMLGICDKYTGRIAANESQTGMGDLYGHGVGTLFLAEAYGMTRREDIHAKLTKAIEFICKQQNPDGGWGPGRSDLPITCAMYMALRSARHAGIDVPALPLAKFERFVTSCFNDDGGFRQTPDRGNASMYYPTTAAIRILYGLGKGDTKMVQAGTKFVMDRRLGQDYGGRISEWCYCGAYWAAGAMLIEDGEAWKKWFPSMRDFLCRIQNSDGSWTIEYCSHCKAYATALNVCTLQAPYRVLPIYQL